jgi:ketosteroid isomerase-like protein
MRALHIRRSYAKIRRSWPVLGSLLELPGYQPERKSNMNRILAVSLFLLALTASSVAKPPQSTAKKSSAGAAPDSAYMQKIWDGWATLDPAQVAKFYAVGPHTFFDIAPLEYASWDAYEKGAKDVLSGYKSAKFTVNDDAAIHPHGDLVWGTATVKEEMTTKGGKVEMGNFRWTVVWENQGGRWLIVHEHVSAPLP